MYSRIALRLLIAFFMSIFSYVYASPVYWGVAGSAFPTTQSLGNTGHEKTPYGHVDLVSGDLVFDIPEVSIKGDRGLDFVLSRSYGKANRGFRSLANWELEVPRLVIATAPSTKLGTDDSKICENNGDLSNETIAGAPLYSKPYGPLGVFGVVGAWSVVDSRSRPITLQLPMDRDRIFYPINGSPASLGYPSNAKYISQDNWYISCENAGNDFKVNSSTGLAYYFPAANRENQTGSSVYKAIDHNNSSGHSVFEVGQVSIYASKVENQFGESYRLSYDRLKISPYNWGGAYNDHEKLLLNKVVHYLDGIRVNSKNDLELVYEPIYFSGCCRSDDPLVLPSNPPENFALRSINKLIKNSLVSWVSYSYAQAPSASSELVYAENNAIQDANPAPFYLTSAGYINGEAVSYQYGGPYRFVSYKLLVDDAKPLYIGPNGYKYTGDLQLRWYSDLTNATYYVTSAQGVLQQTRQVNWFYQSYNIAQPGHTDAKSFRVSKSVSSGVGIGSYEASYDYTSRNTNNEQTTSVIAKDVVADSSRAYTYKYFSFAGGLAEDFKHGLLKSVVQGDRTETYEWTDLYVFGKYPQFISNLVWYTPGLNYGAYDSVSYSRLKKKTVEHFGTYTTEYSNFDIYGNARAVTTSGLNGTAAISRTTTLDFYNANYASQDVVDGTHPWLVGLPKSSTNSPYINFSNEYDVFGALVVEDSKGIRTTYRYESPNITTCLGMIASFEWQAFINCVGNYVFGDKHKGLPIQKYMGGELVSYYADYSKGVPGSVRNPNGSTETNEVDDFGNVTRHVDADGLLTYRVYDDAGRLKEDRPINGLAVTKTVYDGLTVTTTTSNGGDMVTKQEYNADGKVLVSSSTSQGRTIYNTRSYDAFGNLRSESFPSTAYNDGQLMSKWYSYDAFNRVLTATNFSSTKVFCYQSCEGVTGAISTVSVAGDFEDAVTRQNHYALGDFDASLVSRSETKGTDGVAVLSTVVYDANSLLPLSAKQGNSKQTYTYYDNGLLNTSNDSNSANATKLTKYTYDTVARVEKITHPDGTNEVFNYDVKIGNLVKTRTWNGATISYDYTPAGRMKSAVSPGVSLNFELDTVGRPKAFTQSIDVGGVAKSYKVTYGYNKLSQITSITYPDNKVVSFANQNQFGEILSVPNVIQSIGYNAWHRPTTITANADVSWTYTYDVDGKLAALGHAALGGCQINLIYDYDPAKRLNSITDGCGNNYNATFIRFGSGQLKNATLSQGTYDYTYTGQDIKTVKIRGLQTGVSTKNYTYSYAAGTSKLMSVAGSGYSSFVYDDMNRVLNDGQTAFTYDPFGRVQVAGDATNYYAHDNLRVRSVKNGSTKDFVYGLDGELLYEAELSTGLIKRYVYAAGQLLATLEAFPDTDTDADGLTDVEEKEHGTNPAIRDAFRDTDDDGIPDYLEKYFGLDSNKADSDGDGFSDGYELNTLGLIAALSPNTFPSQPEPEKRAEMVPIIHMLLDDDES